MKTCFIYTSKTAGRFVYIVLVIWVVIIIYTGGPLLKRTDDELKASSSQSPEKILAQLSVATEQLHSLKKENLELRNLIQNRVSSNELFIKHLSGTGQRSRFSVLSKDSSLSSVPDPEFEHSRRRLLFNINELWFFITDNLKYDATLQKYIDEYRAILSHDLNKIAQRDYLWRKSELLKLSLTVKKAIDRLQNPKDCLNTKKLVCSLNKGCGFGCQIHHVSYCLVVALASNRTLILDSLNWRYAPNFDQKTRNAGWNLVFQPLSKTCVSENSIIRQQWSLKSEAQVLHLPIIDALHPRPEYLPLSIPEEISQKLILVHGVPSVWFIGQIVRYIMRPSSNMQSYIKAAKKKFKFRTPIVGIHVRRTDKIGTEASFHPLSEYMKYAQDYFERLRISRQLDGDERPIEKIIYLATDDADVWKEEIKPYESQGFFFIGDSKIAQTAGVRQRYSVESLKNVILDVELLSECDFLVCTFSSQICRLAYELMQARGTKSKDKVKLDWSNEYRSLDDIYYFGGQNPHNQIAILDHFHSRSDEIELKKGDIIGIAGNHWNGFSKGLNRRNGISGLYPGFKTQEEIKVAKFDAFESLD